MATLQSFKEAYPEAPDWACAINDKVSMTYNELSQFTSRLESIESEQGHILSLVDDSKALSKETRDHCEELEDRLTKLELQNKQLSDKVAQLEDYSRRLNLKFDGVPESKDETDDKLRQAMYSVLQNSLKLDDIANIKLERVHRLGRRTGNANASNNRPRPVIVRFLSYTDRDMVWRKRFELKGTNIFVSEDFSNPTEETRRKLYPYLRSAKVAGAKCTLRGDRLIIEGKSYTTKTVQHIPIQYSPKYTSTRHGENAILFHGKDSFLSNFHRSPFTEDLTNYEHVEMYFQCKKAEHYNHEDIAQKIRSEPDPAKCKQLGDRIKTTDDTVWTDLSKDIMLKAVVLKFSQNEDLKAALLSTGNKILAEASKHPFWATGKSLYDPTAFDGWTGDNNLGKILMLVRDRLKDD